MIETKIVKEGGVPKFVIMDYKLFDRFRALIEGVEDELDAKLDADELGPAIPWEVADKMMDGKSGIAAWREYRGWTQKELARRLGVTQAAVARLEKPGSNPRRSTLQKLAKALKCPPEALI